MPRLTLRATGGISFLTPAEWNFIARRLNLSPRELEIVAHVLADEKESTIALGLAISSHTVHTFLKRLYLKLGVTSRVELVMRVFAEYATLPRQGILRTGQAAQPTLRKAA
jgi:DNA-binding CsgD family transcriptional regulator